MPTETKNKPRSRPLELLDHQFDLCGHSVSTSSRPGDEGSEVVDGREAGGKARPHGLAAPRLG
jgi:hypothetical protein